MASSGTRVTGRIVWRECDNCGFEGDVDEVIDPEIPYSGWECPSCLTGVDTTETVFDTDEDPDDARDRELENAWFG